MKLALPIAVAVLAATANAISIGGLSSSCTATLAPFLLGGDISSCLQVSSLLPVLNANNGSIIDPLNGYLTSLCASSTPTCSEDTLNSAATSVQSGCASDLQSGGLANVLLSVLNNYPTLQQAACTKNSTNDAFCVADTLSTVEQTTGTTVSVDTIMSLVSGDDGAEGSLDQAIGTGSLCTGCVASIYNAAVTANSTASSSALGQRIVGQCGDNFAQSTQGIAAPSAASASLTATITESAAGSVRTAESGAGRAWAGGAVALVAGVVAAAVAF